MAHRHCYLFSPFTHMGMAGEREDLVKRLSERSIFLDTVDTQLQYEECVKLVQMKDL